MALSRLLLVELLVRKLAKKRLRCCEMLGVALPEKASATAPVTSLSLSLVRWVTLRSTWLVSLGSIDEL